MIAASSFARRERWVILLFHDQTSDSSCWSLDAVRAAKVPVNLEFATFVS